MRLSFVAAVLVAGWPLVCIAQENVSDLNQVIVTASRSSEPLESAVASVTLITRADIDRLQPHSVDEMLTGLVGMSISNNGDLGKTASVLVRGTNADHVLVFFGLHPKLGPIAEWGLELEKKALKVDTEKFQTSLPGVFAIGDINTYPGKKKLILSGFHEAALAAFAIQHHLFPQKKQFLQYTTTSPIMHQRLGVPD